MTGKNKENFEKWYKNKEHRIPLYQNECNYVIAFDNLPLSMQWGVYLEYYDSIGIDLDMECNKSNHDWILTECEFDRQDVQKTTLEKANELANEKL